MLEQRGRRSGSPRPPSPLTGEQRGSGQHQSPGGPHRCRRAFAGRLLCVLLLLLRHKGWWTVMNLSLCEPRATPTQARSEASPTPPMPRSLRTPPHQHTPEGTSILTGIALILPVLELHLSGTIWCVFFSIWLLSSAPCEILRAVARSCGSLFFIDACHPLDDTTRQIYPFYH